MSNLLSSDEGSQEAVSMSLEARREKLAKLLAEEEEQYAEAMRVSFKNSIIEYFIHGFGK